jgi:TRAP transporter 4TM/12TM fusion protein
MSAEPESKETSKTDPLSTTYSEPLRSKSPVELLIYTVSFSFFIYVMWFSYTAAIPRTQYAIVVLGVHLFLWGIIRAKKRYKSSLRQRLIAAAYTIYALVSIIPTAYFSINYIDVARRPGFFFQMDIVMGAILLGLILIGVILVSRVIAIVAIFGLIYAYFGEYFPTVFQHNGLTLQRIITMNTAEMAGIYGEFLVIGATWVLLFMYVAGFLEAYGGMSKIVLGASDLINRTPYFRLGQIGVLASMAMGSINGSIAANVATTGSFTIPVMKSNKYPAPFAGGIEAVASSGGQILPPIMGAAAFIMATLIEPSYADIIIAAVFPAIIFYVSVAFAIQIKADKYQIDEVSERDSETTDTSIMMKIFSNFEYILAFAVLIYALAYLRLSPTLAGLYTIVTLIGLKMMKMAYEIVGFDSSSSNRSSKDAFTEFNRRTLEGMRSGIEFNLDLLIMFVALATVVRTFVVTGLSLRLSTILVIFAGDSFVLLLIVAMLASLLFGMAVSTTPAYLLAAILVAPALVQTGMQPLLAHFFVFLFAVAAGITPPIAVGVVVATGIADSGFMETALEALSIGYSMLLLPYAIIINPQLLHPSFQSFVLFIIILVGMLSISLGINGYFRHSLSIPWRGFYLLVGILCIVVPGQQFIFGIAVAFLGTIAMTYHFFGSYRLSSMVATYR